jgi:serine O-acetyltransferase
MFDNIRADLRSYEGRWWEQGFWVMVVYRFGRWRYGVKPALLRKPLSLVYKVAYKFIQIITGIDLPCEAVVGRNFVIDHFGGIIVSGFAKFGDNCRIRDGVSIGLRRVEEPCAPTIGNNVDIGTGAKLLGNITIGDNVLIGANAVVITDVPSNSMAMGVPAVIRPRSADKREAPQPEPNFVPSSPLSFSATLPRVQPLDPDPRHRPPN